MKDDGKLDALTMDENQFSLSGRKGYVITYVHRFDRLFNQIPKDIEIGSK